MKDLLIINTGGTFNKIYNPLTGTLDVDKDATALYALASRWLTSFQIVNIIGKDSLEMTSQDRLEMLATIHHSPEEKILIVHGTDTMHISAEYLDDAETQKQIVLTGAMVPYSIDPVEATANFASAFGFLCAEPKRGIYIAMNGIVAPYDRIRKDHTKGVFLPL
ncbi:MAG: asparaginase domain-containing protein [Sulfurovum sp.]|nr:asparaginase domain-containing protein [Sulfurovum sp.]